MTKQEKLGVISTDIFNASDKIDKALNGLEELGLYSIELKAISKELNKIGVTICDLNDSVGAN